MATNSGHFGEELCCGFYDGYSTASQLIGLGSDAIEYYKKRMLRNTHEGFVRGMGALCVE